MTENSSRTVSSWSSCKSAPGRTPLRQLQTGLNDPPKHSALEMVKSISSRPETNRRSLVWNQTDRKKHDVVMALQSTSGCSRKNESTIWKVRRNSNPVLLKAELWYCREEQKGRTRSCGLTCPTASCTSSPGTCGLTQAKELERAELLLININTNPPLLQEQSYYVTFRAGASHHYHDVEEL